MTIVRFAALLPLLLALTAPGAELDPAERAAGFRLLFDGETLDGWKAFGRDEAPPGWAVEEGTLARIDKGGDIATVESFGNFELRLEWRISEGGNSGIFYRTTDGTHRTGPEMQVLDDERHRDRFNPTHRAGACYDMYVAEEARLAPVGSWNRVRIIARGPFIEHWLNDTCVVRYEIESPDWNERWLKSKYRGSKAYGRNTEGKIVLQDHGDPVWYRNIRIRPLDAPAVKPETGQAVVRAGDTVMVAVRALEMVDAERTFSVTSSDEDIVAIVEPVLIPAGRNVGFTRVRGLMPGEATICIDGTHRVVVRVEPAPAAAAPMIVGPSPGSSVWGTVSVGVDLDAGDEPVMLRVGKADPIAPVSDTGTAMAPHRRVRFEVDFGSIAPGPCRLEPIVGDQVGAMVLVDVVRVEDVLAHEAESVPALAERPARFADDRRHVGRDRRASGGAYFSNAAAVPAVCVGVEVPEAGWYQMIVRAGAQQAQRTLPTVGVVIDNEPQSTTNGRLLDDAWHRLAIGVPVRLEAGARVLTPFFANDFFVPGRADRNLRLDRIEIARVPAPTPRVVDDRWGHRDKVPRLAFTRTLDGATIPGIFEIAGRVSWFGDVAGPPVVELHVNGAPVLAQRSRSPRFWVDPNVFNPGANEIALVTRIGDVELRTVNQTMYFAPEVAAERLAPRVHHRFSIHEPAWQLDTAPTATPGSPEQVAVAFASKGSAALALPDDLTGEYRVFLELRGQSFKGPAEATVRVRADEAIDVGVVRAPDSWNLREVGRVVLAEGPKSLEVAFENDLYEEGVGDRNLYLASAILAMVPLDVDRGAPLVEVDHPRDGEVIFGQDVVIVRAADNASLATAQLLVDGSDVGIHKGLSLKTGNIVLPLPGRVIEPGEHTIEVRVSDVAGNVGLSEARTIIVEAEEPIRRTRYERAVRLLDRLAFGPDERELAAILAMGESAWLADRLAGGADNPGDAAARELALFHFGERNNYTVSARAIGHAIGAANPVRARFVLWAQNHFSTWVRKSEAQRKWDEHIAFTNAGIGRFGDLLRTSAQSPAMLAYLDQSQSVTGRINENYARELMELHTLGVGSGYEQEDVTQLARLLTGWTEVMQGDGITGGPQARTYDWRFDPVLHDGDDLTLLGMPFSADADPMDRVNRAFELLAAHPATARFVSTKLIEHYVDAPAPPFMVDDLAEVFRETGGDFGAMLVHLVDSGAIFEAPERFAPPLDWAVRFSRTTNRDQPWQVMNFLNSSGAGLFDRATPDGYPAEDEAYGGANAMTQRWRTVDSLWWAIVGFVPWPYQADRQSSEADYAMRAADFMAIGLTGRSLSAASSEAVVEFFTALEGSRRDRLRPLATFVGRLPEVQIR